MPHIIFFYHEVPNKTEFQQVLSNLSTDASFKSFIKLYKEYTKETISYLVNDTTFSLDKPLRFRNNLL